MRALRGMLHLYYTYNKKEMHIFMTVPLSSLWCLGLGALTRPVPLHEHDIVLTNLSVGAAYKMYLCIEYCIQHSTYDGK